MTTYNGRSAGYIPGKEVPNKEPPVSKFVVEKLYRVHRERIMKCEPTIDSYVQIPDFLTNQSWKKNAEIQKQARIAKHNQEVYDRIAKVENEESQYTVANRVHVKRIKAKSGYLKKLKEHGRLVHLLKIQRENEYLLRRIEKAKPEYTNKQCKEWYRHHELFKAGRRSDPTAGHIMTNMGDLLPGLLPPLTYDGSSYNHDSIDSLSRHKSKTLPSLGGSSLEEPSFLAGGSSIISSSVTDMHSQSLMSQQPFGAQHMPPHQHQQQQITSMPPRASVVQRQSTLTKMGSSKSVRDHNIPSPTGGNDETTSLNSRGSQQPKKSGTPARESTLAFSSFIEKKEGQDKMSTDTSRYNSETDNHSHHSDAVTEATEGGEELILITSKPFPVPFDNKNCIVQVFSSRAYDENIYLKVVSSGLSSVKIYSERGLPIDKAYDIVNAGGHSSQIVHSSDGEDLHSLSSLLIDMFKEADDNGDGFLTFDEFQLLMEKVELGISPQELRFVISEADENENGVVDYDEFVELGVDLIQSFRARNRAKDIISHQDIMLDDQIMKEISANEVSAIADYCLEKIYEIDTKKYGLIRLPDLKKCLTVAQTAGKISDTELLLICQMLPRDQFGRCKYNTAPHTFMEILHKVKFATMKNAMVEQHGSGLQKYLIDLCREEEAKIDLSKGPKEKFVPSGVIPCRALINILNSAPRLSLSRLQVLVIMSEASVLDGMINYFHFVPVVAKAIEIMFEPKALRQRAELILKTDLSPEALLTSLHSDAEGFQMRLKTLFKSFDIDGSDGLDQNEFVACLEALELQLTFQEMVALFENAEETHSGHLKYPDFCTFFTSNLLNLERERHIRMLQSSMHLHYSHRHTDTNTPGNATENEDALRDTELEQRFVEELTAVFKLSDPDNTGFITFSAFEDVLKDSSGFSISKFLLDVMLSELHTEVNGLVDYKKSLVICAELLKVYKAKESAEEEQRAKEADAEARSLLITQASIEDINHITRFLRKKIKRIVEGTNDVALRYNEFYRLFKDPHTGLSRSESNVLIKILLHTTVKNTESPKLYKEPGMDSDGDFTRPTSALAPGVNVPNMRVVPSSFTGTFSTHDLFDAVFEARKSSVMRGLLENVDSSTTQMAIIVAIEKELAKLREAGEIAADSKFMPVKSCFAVLENTPELRLNRAQIMFIISWAECFDKEGHNLEAFKFADHAASIIAKMHLPAMLDTRVEVMNQGGIDEKKVLNGMKLKDIESFLETAFSELSPDGEITPEQLWETIKSIPRLKISDREATTVVAAYHSPTVKWREILSSTVTTLRSLCKERMINRRVSLAAGSVPFDTRSSMDATDSLAIREESMKLLKQLADKLLNFVKLALQGDNIVLVLPIDTNKGRASQLTNESSSSSSHSRQNHLFKGVKTVPTITFKSVLVQPAPLPQTMGTPTASGVARRVSSGMFGKPVQQIEEVKGTMAVLLHIVSVEDQGVNAGGMSLVANVINVDASVRVNSTLSVKLPSIGMVDREAAEQYAANLVDTMYIESKEGVHTLKLRN